VNLILTKKDINAYLILLIYISISGLILLLSNNIFFDIFSMVFLVFGAMNIVKYDLAHPYVWYSFFFTLYSVAYPILYLTNNVYDINTYTKSLMFSQWLGLVIFLLVLTPKSTEYFRMKKLNFNLIPDKIFLILTSIVLFVTILKISRGSHLNKTDLYSEGSIIVNIGFRAVLVFLILFAINLSIYVIRRKKLDKKITIYAGVIIFFMVYFSGERDLLLRFILIIFYIYYIFIKNKKLSKEIIILGVVTLFLIPFLGAYKHYGITGEVTITNNNFLIDFLMSEFMAASKNMQILLLDESALGRFNGETFISGILNTFDIDKLLGLNIVSSVSWYNANYFNAGRSGQGFTIVGEGYINFGYIGIILVFIFIGVIVRYIYKNSNKGIYHFVFYILSIPIFIYSTRADLANILSPLLKQNLLSIIIIIIGTKILYKSPKEGL
jgi:oligosaccharide repeat unit polymerase